MADVDIQYFILCFVFDHGLCSCWYGADINYSGAENLDLSLGEFGGKSATGHLTNEAIVSLFSSC